MSLLYKLTVHLWFSPSGNQRFSEVCIVALNSREAPEGVVGLRLRLPAFQMLRLPMLQRLLFRNAYSNTMSFGNFIFNCLCSRWRLHSSCISDMASTCHKDRDPLGSIIFQSVQFLHISATIFHCFYVSAIRRPSREFRKHQPAYRNMKRLKAFMSTKGHCA